MGRLLFFLYFLVFSTLSWAQQSSTRKNQLAISQGISSPAMSHTTLFSNGFTLENPVAVAYQSGYHFTGTFDGAETTSGGVEFGVGDTQYGLALGAYSNACEENVECDPFIRGSLSAIWGGFGVGFGVQEDLYTVGFLINANGMHRVGIVAEFEDRDGFNNRRDSVGIGYSFVMEQFTFSTDISKRDAEDPLLADDALLVTPGIAIRIDAFSVSVSYDIFMNDDRNNFSDQVWFGIGIQAFSNWEFSFYGEYNDRWTLGATYFF